MLVITDTHFRGEIFDIQLDALASLLVWEKPSHVLHLGDLGHRGTFGDADQPASTMVKKFADFVSEHGIPWTILAGNHDYSGSACALDFFHHPLIHAVKEPEILDIDGKEIAAIPWCHGESVKDAIKGLESADMLVGHADLCGYVWMGQSLGADSAFAVHPNWWKHLDCVVEFGHIHHTDKYFLGSVWPNNFGEAEHRGSYGVWTSDGYERREMPKHAQIRYRELTAEKAQSIQGRKFLGTQFWKVRHSGPRPELNLPENVHVTYVREAKQNKRTSRIAANWDTMTWSQQVDAFVESGYGPPISEQALRVIKDEQVNLHDPADGTFRLDSIRVTDYGCLASKEVCFGDFTAILGKNGVGKSTILSSVATAAFGSPPDGRQVGELTTKKTEIELSIDGTSYVRRWFGERYVIGGKAVNQQEWEAGLPLPPQNVFFAANYVTQERYNGLLADDGVQRFKTLSAMVGCTFGHLVEKFPTQKIASLERSLEDARTDRADAEAAWNAAEQEVLKAAKALRKERDAFEANAKAAQARKDLEDKAEFLGDFLDEKETELTKISHGHQLMLREHKVQLEKFTARAAKAGCVSNPIPCPLLKKPDAPEQPELFVVYKERELLTEGRLPKCYPLLSAEGKKWCDDYVSAVKELERTTDSMEKFSTTDATERTVKLLQSQLKSAETQLGRSLDGVRTAEQRLERCHKELEETKVLNECAWFFGPGGIQRWWLETRLEAIAERANEYLTEVEQPISIRFLAGDGKHPRIDILVELDDVERPYRTLSGGQKTFVALAIWCALSRGFLLLDEPFVGLHSSVVPDACRILRRAAKDRQVIVVTHEQLVSNYADTEVRL